MYQVVINKSHDGKHKYEIYIYKKYQSKPIILKIGASGYSDIYYQMAMMSKRMHILEDIKPVKIGTFQDGSHVVFGVKICSGISKHYKNQ